MLRIAVAPQLPSVNHLSINRLTDIIEFDRYYSVQAEPESLVQITIAYYNLNILDTRPTTKIASAFLRLSSTGIPASWKMKAMMGMTVMVKVASTAEATTTT